MRMVQVIIMRALVWKASFSSFSASAWEPSLPKRCIFVVWMRNDIGVFDHGNSYYDWLLTGLNFSGSGLTFSFACWPGKRSSNVQIESSQATGILEHGDQDHCMYRRNLAQSEKRWCEALYWAWSNCWRGLFCVCSTGSSFGRSYSVRALYPFVLGLSSLSLLWLFKKFCIAMWTTDLTVGWLIDGF